MTLKKPISYKIILSKDAVQDIKSTKKYILTTFKYQEYADKFSKNMKFAIQSLNPFAGGYETTGYMIDGSPIYYKPYSTYLIFFVVDGRTVTVIRVLKDRMYWQSIIKKMKQMDK